jgi:hypothetical protein
MAEFGVTYTLTTPAGTLTFNPTPSNQDGYYLSDVQGLDGGNVRTAVSDLPQRDGAYVFDSQLGPMFPTLTGFMRCSTLSARTTLMDNLKAALNTIRFADGTLSWTASGDGAARSVTVRLAAAPQISQHGGIIKSFSFQLVAANPFTKRGSSNVNLSSFASSGGVSLPVTLPFSLGGQNAGSVTITPGGTAPAWPVITINGPIASPVISNLTTGKVLYLPGFTMASGNQLVVDMWNELVYLNAAANDQIGFVDATSSDFWSLTNGTPNLVQVSGTSIDPATTGGSVTYSDTLA